MATSANKGQAIAKFSRVGKLTST
ncbi:hypothetical protein E2320_021009, partial [Naja naja]